MPSVNAVPARLNLTCVGGDDLNVLCTFTWSDGTPVNLLGPQTAQVRDHPTSDVVRATLEVVDSGLVDGKCVISLDAAVTRSLLAHGADPLVPTAYYGYWDVQSQHPTSLQTRTIAGGAFNVHVDVTRP